MEESVIMEHTVTLQRAPGFGSGISGGRGDPHFQSGETSIVISDVFKGRPAKGRLQKNNRVVKANAVSMDNVEQADAVQQLRKSGRNPKITIRRKRKVQMPASRTEDGETMSEDEEDTDEDAYEQRAGPSAYAGASGRTGTGRRHGRKRSGRWDRRASRERSVSDRRWHTSAPLRPSEVTLVKSRRNEETEYGLLFVSHIVVKAVRPESLAARDGNIQEGDVVLKMNGTLTENLSLRDVKKLIERSTGHLKMVVQRARPVPDLDDSIPSTNTSDKDDFSEIRSLTSDHSNRCQGCGRSRSPDSCEPSDHLRHSPGPITNGSHRSRDEDRLSKPGDMFAPVKSSHDGDPASPRDDQHLPPLPEPKPVCVQPDVHLPVSPCDAPVPNAAHGASLPRPSMKLVKFKKGESVGLRLAGGNDVGIFVAGVLEDSPAAKEGLEEGDQILRVNNVDFANIIREEAVLFLLNLQREEEVIIVAQKKKDVYRKMVESDVGDSFYIRTHFEYEKESLYGLSFNKGEVFRVVDTLYNGKLGSWLAIRIGKNHQEVERGIIPNQNRAQQLSSVQCILDKTPGRDRADFWRRRRWRSSKRTLRKSPVQTQQVQTKFPAYERVVLREASFLRPVVLFGPIADVAREKLTREEPDIFELAKSEPRDAGADPESTGVIRLHTIQQIIDRDKHAVLDITPNAVDRLNYVQWYPIVVFLNPDTKQGAKNMRTRLCPESRKSARKLYERALKLRKNSQHLFTTTINLNNMNDGWFGALKENIQQQQKQLVWVSEVKADGAGEDMRDHVNCPSYLSAPGSEYSMYSTDSWRTNDFEDTYAVQQLDETLNGDSPAASYVVQPDPLNRINPAGFKALAPQQLYQKDPYNADNTGRIGGMKPVSYNASQGYHPDQQPDRDYDPPPSHYEFNSRGGYTQPKHRNNVPHYDQQQWNPNVPPHAMANSQSYDSHVPHSDSPESQYTPPVRYDQPPPPQAHDRWPRFGKPTGSGPVWCDKRLPSAPGHALHFQDSHLNAYPSGSCSHDPAAQRPAYNQGPALHQKGYKPQQNDPTSVNSSPTPPSKNPSPVPVDVSKALQTRDDKQDEDPAMKPQSIRTRVKMFENQRSVSVNRARDSGYSTGNRATGVMTKALSNLDQVTYRAPEPQQPWSKVTDDIVRSNHYDPGEDEDYYRKQLSYFDLLLAPVNHRFRRGIFGQNAAAEARRSWETLRKWLPVRMVFLTGALLGMLIVKKR